MLQNQDREIILISKQESALSEQYFSRIVTSNFPQNISKSIFGFPTTLSATVIKPVIHIKNSKYLIMNLKSVIKTVLIFLSFVIISNYASAQATAVSGPSDATLTPPVSASAVSQIVAPGGSISLKMGNSLTATDINYKWYKLDQTGTKRLVQDGSSSTLTETTAGAGYYTYQLVISNSNQCTSEISDPFKVYVLPALNPTIAASSGTICSNGTSTSTLTANPGNSSFSYQYQWALNGTNITGATAATYTTPTNTTGNNTYSVKVAYVLSSATAATATQVINMIPVPTKPAISVGQ
jgi:hypothetical protein